MLWAIVLFRFTDPTLWRPEYVGAAKAIACACPPLVLSLATGWNASDVESWFAGVVRSGVADRTQHNLRAFVCSFVQPHSIGDAKEVEARMRGMPVTHVAFLCCVAVTEAERVAAGSLVGVLEYLKSACRPEGATAGVFVCGCEDACARSWTDVFSCSRVCLTARFDFLMLSTVCASCLPGHSPDDAEANAALVAVVSVIGDAVFSSFIRNMQSVGRTPFRESVIEDVCLYVPASYVRKLPAIPVQLNVTTDAVCVWRPVQAIDRRFCRSKCSCACDGKPTADDASRSLSSPALEPSVCFCTVRHHYRRV